MIMKQKEILKSLQSAHAVIENFKIDKHLKPYIQEELRTAIKILNEETNTIAYNEMLKALKEIEKQHDPFGGDILFQSNSETEGFFYLDNVTTGKSMTLEISDYCELEFCIMDAGDKWTLLLSGQIDTGECNRDFKDMHKIIERLITAMNVKNEMDTYEKSLYMHKHLKTLIGKEIIVKDKTYTFDMEYHSGSFFFHAIKNYDDAIYCPPFWEDTDGIAFAIYKEGSEDKYDDAPFEITENPEIDVKKYFEIVENYINNL